MIPFATIARAQRGRYLWGVRLGEGSLLSWQVGDPHLHVELGRGPGGFEQRFAEARGKWQVEIVDGRVQLTTPLGEATFDGESVPNERDEDVLATLEGQALVSCEVGDTLTLRFDLEGELVVSGPHALVRISGPEGDAEWTP